MHFHVCVVDGVFEALPNADSVNAPSVTFHPAQIDDVAIAQMQVQVQTNVRKRLLRAFVARGHLESHDAKDINERAASSQHGGGLSVDAGVCIEAPDRAGLERLLRYCSRPPFAMDRLKQRGADLVYRCGKGHNEVFPLIWPNCGSQMRVIAFITFSADIHRILEHIGVEPQAPRITPARGPPLWDECGAQAAQELGEGEEAGPDWDLANQSPPDYPDDQRTTW